MGNFNNGLINGLLTSTGIANAYKTFAKTPVEVENLRQQAALRGSQTRYHDSRADENVRKAQLLEEVIRNPEMAADVGRAYASTNGKPLYGNGNVKGTALELFTGRQPVGNADAFSAELENMREQVALSRARSEAQIARAQQSRASAGHQSALTRRTNEETANIKEGKPRGGGSSEQRATVRKGPPTAADRVAEREGLLPGGAQAGGYRPDTRDEEIKRRYQAGEITREQAIAMRNGGR